MEKKFKVTTLYLSIAMKQNFGRELKLSQKGVLLSPCFPNLSTANTGAKVWPWILIRWTNVDTCICSGHLLWTSCSEYWVTLKWLENSGAKSGLWSQVHQHLQWEKLLYVKELIDQILCWYMWVEINGNWNLFRIYLILSNGRWYRGKKERI